MLPLYQRSIILYRKTCLLCRKNLTKIVLTGLRIQPSIFTMNEEPKQTAAQIPLFKNFEDLKEPSAMLIPDLKPNEKIKTKLINLTTAQTNVFLLIIVILSIISFLNPSRASFAVVLVYIAHLLLCNTNEVWRERPIYNIILMFGGGYCLAALLEVIEGSYPGIQLALLVTFIHSFMRLRESNFNIEQIKQIESSTEKVKIVDRFADILQM